MWTNARAAWFLPILIFLIFPLGAQAFFFDVGLLYYSDALTSSGYGTATARNNYDFGIGFEITKTISIGWNYSIVSTSDTPAGGGTATTFSSNDMGPKIIWFFSKDKTWYLGLAYNLLANATFTPPSGTAQKWGGTSINVDVAYMPPISENFSFGLKLSYYAPSYTSVIVNGTTYSTTDNSRSQIFPSISMLLYY